MNEPDTIDDTDEADVASRDVAREVKAPVVEPEPTRDTRLTLALTALACSAAALVWIGAAARSTGHGFDLTDEGYYLLSYRWWSTHYRNFTGAQYLYGPVFQALGYSIAGLRVFRLFTQIAAHGVLAYTFMRWLRERRPNAPRTLLWEVAGATAIVASAGIAYSWLPLSPGYNDVSLLGAMLGAAVVLRAGTYVDRGVAVPRWVPLSFGPIIVFSVFAKWASSAVSVGVAGLALAVVLSPRGLREIARFTAWTVASVVATTLFIHVFVIRLGTALPPMLSVNKALTSHGNSVGPLLQLYWTTARDLAKRIADRDALLVLAAVVAVVGRRPVLQWGASLLTLASFAAAYAEVEQHRGTVGGAGNISEFPAGPVATILLAIIVGVLVLATERVTAFVARARRPSPAAAQEPVTTVVTSSLTRDGLRGCAVLAMLALTPVTQALGTGNPIYFMAVNGFAAWMAIIIAILTGIEAAPFAARWLMTATAAAAIFLTVAIGSSGVRLNPYRTAGHDLATDVAGGVPALRSVRVSSNEAANLSRLHSVLEPYIDPPGRAIMAFDESAGVVLALDGQPVGEAWYSSGDAIRAAAGITEECTNKKPYWGSRLPLILVKRVITSADLAAFRSCGFDLATDYRQLGSRQDTMGFTVYVPVREGTKETP
jgi:hypothetical protein